MGSFSGFQGLVIVACPNEIRVSSKIQIRQLQVSYFLFIRSTYHDIMDIREEYGILWTGEMRKVLVD